MEILYSLPLNKEEGEAVMMALVLAEADKHYLLNDYRERWQVVREKVARMIADMEAGRLRR